jgi:protein-S-isoprenylcysteine O-methyltransferase Ste14
MTIDRTLTLGFGVVSYGVFFLTFLYAIGFVGDVFVPKSLDSGPVGDWPTALLIDLGLLTVFALQHSIMARPAFKRWLTRSVPAVAERSVYVLASSLALILLFWQWQPLGGVVWDVQSPVARVVLHCGFAFGWLTVLGTTFAIDHFDLFGLRQTWRHFRGLPQRRLQFVTPAPYRIVRHPLYVGWLFAFWSTPTMTAAHLVFALATTAYILIAIRFEERDLLDAHPEYAAYRARVPMLVPRLPTRTRTQSLKTFTEGVRS